ncbi:ANM_HP_G0096080.mRNA.1.CDS.1 [Saccharomyces cerevisiae]|nr:ANM_HP_G0096080.mRNA.1.CDS.1 [Saccharomyces cerevisiae]CAI6382378.1 ANM_HP_G0096080.mRNA.1.CDS.1 [Saccharomyces cerevisiae]
MSTCIAAQANLWKGKLRPGDVLVSNHPDIGGNPTTRHNSHFSNSRSNLGDYFSVAYPGLITQTSRSSWFSASQLQKLCSRRHNFFRVDCQKGYFSRRTNLQTFTGRTGKSQVAQDLGESVTILAI